MHKLGAANAEARVVAPRPEQPPLIPTLNEPANDDVNDLDLGYIAFLLRQHRWSVIAFICLLTTATAIFELSRPKLYASAVTVRIDAAGGDATVGQDRQPQSAVDPQILMLTEVTMATSPAVVEKTIRDLHLERYPEFQPSAPAGTALALATPQRDEAILRLVTRMVSVTRPAGALLLQIHFESRSPDLSAAVANSLAASFLSLEYSSRSAALRDSSSALALQLDAMRQQMEKDQQHLVAYQAENDVVDPDDKTNIMQARLQQMNEDLSRADSARLQDEANYNTALRGDVDGVAAVSQDNNLLALRQRLVTDRRTMSEDAAVYGPNHRIYQQQAKLVQFDQNALEAEVKRVTDQLANQYKADGARVELISTELAGQKLLMDALALKAITYHTLKGAAESSSRLYYELQQRLQDAEVAANLHSEELRIVDPARPEFAPVYPHVLLDSLLAFLVSILLGLGAIVGIALLDTTVSSPDQVQRWFGLPVFGILPTEKHPIALSPMVDRSDNGGERSEIATPSAFRDAILSLHSSIALNGGERWRVIALTSARPGEGKSTIASTLAPIFAALDGPTLLLDGDLRKPKVHRLFEIPNHVGLTSLLAGKATIDESLVRISGCPNLAVLPSGPRIHNHAEFMYLNFRNLLDQLRDRFEFIIIDCPPLIGFPETLQLTADAEAVLIVAAAGEINRNSLSASLRQIRANQANVAGVVLNRMSSILNVYYGNYGSSEYSQYYSPQADED